MDRLFTLMTARWQRFDALEALALGEDGLVLCVVCW